MRYYRITINDTDTNQTLLRTWSSLTPAGTPDMGALMIDVDIQRYGMSTPKGMSLLRIHGIPLTEILQAQANFYNKTITVELGMSKGLPLANPLQSGLAITGIINQPFGNWQGTEMSLDFMIVAGAGSNDEPKNIVLQWLAGKKLSAALFFSLQRAFPDKTITINIDDRLVCNNDNTGFYYSLTQLAQTLRAFSKTIITDPNYNGVEFAMRQNEIVVYDGNTARAPIAINFVDLVGQPTWIEFAKASIKLVMRADIQVGDFITMPTGALSVTTAASYSQYRQQSAFTGRMLVTDVRMIGNSRTSDANGWATVLEAVPV